MKMYLNADIYTVQKRNHRKTVQKTSEKRKTKQLTENQKNPEKKNIS